MAAKKTAGKTTNKTSTVKKIDLTKYTDFIVEETTKLLNIDSPTGYTEEAAAWVKKEFEKLGFKATLTNKGGVIVDLTGKDKKDGLLLPQNNRPLLFYMLHQHCIPNICLTNPF